MDSVMKMMADSYVSVFDNYNLTDPDLLAEIAAFKKEVYSFAESCGSDLMKFTSAMQQGGELLAKCSDLNTRCFYADQADKNGGGSNSSSNEGYQGVDYDSEHPSQTVISVKEYLEQYRPGYEEIKKAGYRTGGEAAYEELFRVANRTDDMLEAQLIMEKERLLFKIVSEDALDIFGAVLEAMDPLNVPVSALTNLNVEMYKKVNSDEELTYESNLLEAKTAQVIAWYIPRMNIAALIADYATKFQMAKRAARLNDGSAAKTGLESMAKLRASAKRLNQLMVEDYNTSLNTILTDQFLSLQMLLPKNLDAMGKYKQVLHPNNLRAIKELWMEMISDTSLIDILSREQEHVLYASLNKTADAVMREHRAQVQRAVSQLKYYKYENQLKGFCNKGEE
ncbi:MAG: hypothetical protein MJ092_02330 [Lachnospiraceae bacterium]|nr:hypothetical protein [Lachnospiraceae bacterium]